MAKKRDDYDSPWKKAISLYFPEFMNFFFPQIYSQIDWEKGYEFLDTELQQIVREAEIGAREADKLVKVWQLNGEETWVLIHLEVQSQVQSEFPERMYVYSNRIFDLYRRKVVSLAVLADDQPSWQPSEYAYEIWGCQVLLRFPTVKLLDYSSAMLEESANPFAVVVQAHRTTQQTRQNVHLRYQEKLKIAKSLYRRGYSRQDILELFALLDWMMRLPPEIEQGFKQEIRHYEEDNQMPTVFTIESMAKMETTQEAIIEVLEIRFDSVSNELSEAIKKIYDLEQLSMLHRQAVTIESLAEFQNLVEQVQANLEPYIFE
jgi:hypothetical protein